MEGSPRPAEGLVHGGHLGDRACGGGASGTARSCAATAPAAGGSGPRSNPSGGEKFTGHNHCRKVMGVRNTKKF
uniref:Uncharacterized protein n=1 Tax=Triticum urartu TaxID=4572 RepID=A0A8R7UBM2_TRIUA